MGESVNAKPNCRIEEKMHMVYKIPVHRPCEPLRPKSSEQSIASFNMHLSWLVF